MRSSSDQGKFSTKRTPRTPTHRAPLRGSLEPDRFLFLDTEIAAPLEQQRNFGFFRCLGHLGGLGRLERRSRGGILQVLDELVPATRMTARKLPQLSRRPRGHRLRKLLNSSVQVPRCGPRNAAMPTGGGSAPCRAELPRAAEPSRSRRGRRGRGRGGGGGGGGRRRRRCHPGGCAPHRHRARRSRGRSIRPSRIESRRLNPRTGASVGSGGGSTATSSAAAVAAPVAGGHAHPQVPSGGAWCPPAMTWPAPRPEPSAQRTGATLLRCGARGTSRSRRHRSPATASTPSSWRLRLSIWSGALLLDVLQVIVEPDVRSVALSGFSVSWWESATSADRDASAARRAAPGYTW